MSACMPGQNAASEEMKTLDSAPVSMCTSTSQPYLRYATSKQIDFQHARGRARNNFADAQLSAADACVVGASVKCRP